jgi:hypothetical protein
MTRANDCREAAPPDRRYTRLPLSCHINRKWSRMGNKHLESSHFKVFRTRVPDFPEGKVWHEDSPDFWIHTAAKTLGVEHCLVHIPTHDQSRAPI